MFPALGGGSEEKGFAWDDEDAFFFEAQIELMCWQRAVLKPKPEEECSVGFVEGVGEMVVEVVMGGGEGVISFGFVERGDDVFADVDDGVVLDEVRDERLSDVGIGEACDCHHGLDGFGDFWGTDDEGCASCWEAEFGEREDVHG